MSAIEVFVSYSRHDQSLVVPIVKLMRLGEPGVVFFDLDDIQPGDLWRGRLEEALRSATYLVLFWCEHASHSREVEREYRAAVTTGKKVVPVLLDATPLPPGLDEYQWIDLAGMAESNHRPPPRAGYVKAPAAAPHPSPGIPEDWDPFAPDLPPAPAPPVFGGGPGPAVRTPTPAIDDPDPLFDLFALPPAPEPPAARQMAEAIRQGLMKMAGQDRHPWPRSGGDRPA